MEDEGREEDRPIGRTLRFPRYLRSSSREANVGTGQTFPLDLGPANGRSRRILPVPVGAAERPFTEPTTAVRCRQRDPRAADRVC